ncbi:MAG: Hsp20 family protein [Luteitalea sp.]|nr:Hsp20 family protein [Luteitalea sp.]
MLPFPEVSELAEEVRRLFDDLDRTRPVAWRSAAGVYTPVLDVVERRDAIEIYVDLAGVAAEDVRVLFKAGTLVICGCKRPPEGSTPSATAFHLLERSYGRFARAVRITTAIDVARTRATLRAGEIRVLIPKIEERRGHEFAIPVEKEN